MTDQRPGRGQAPGSSPSGQRSSQAAEPERDWLVSVTGLAVPVRIRASYPCVDEKNYPGWTLLKDRNHKLVAMARDNASPLIQRIDEPGERARS